MNTRCYQCMNEYNESYDMCPYCGYEKNTPAKEMYFLQPGTVILDRYEIGVSVGSGGFGITYKAWDRVLSKIVCVKEYYPVGVVNRIPGEQVVIIYGGSKEREFSNGKIRFLEEAQNMAKFNTHPHIVNVYDFFECNRTAYIVMEFLEGVNYKEYIKAQGGKIPVEKALEVTCNILDALEEVHKNNILHRDISPDNIFICKDGRTKLIDFGAARFSSTEDVKTRSVILKPGFAPPEQYQSKSIQGPWTDVYAVAATLYRSITGTVPEESVNRTEEDLLVEPKKFSEEVTDSLNIAIMRGMALLPDLRFQTAQEFKNVLMSGTKIRDVRRELKLRKIRRLVSVASITVVVLIAAFVCFSVLKQRKDQAAVLDEAEITMWIACEDENGVDEKLQMYHSALTEFKTEYPQVTVNIECMEQSEYQAKLEKALAEGNLPTLFDSSSLSQEKLKDMANVSKVLDYLTLESYYFLDDYKTYFSDKKQMPLAFTMPIVYINTVQNAENLSVDELVDNGNFVYTKDNYLTLHNLYLSDNKLQKFKDLPDVSEISGNVSNNSKNAEERFLNNEEACLISDSSRYEAVQANLAGIYKMELLNETGMVGSFEDCFSINSNASDDEIAAATQILVYLLSENAQDICYVQDGKYLPLNKAIYGAYIQINGEFLKLEDGFDKVLFPGEEQNTVDEWSENIN